jgi:hypothetical protein
VIRLASPMLEVEIDPAMGGEVLAVRGADGRNVLYETPWPCTADGNRGADGDAWVYGWRGGWQLLFPNAGEPCSAEGRAHPFHGDVALGRMKVAVEPRDDAVELAWETLTWSLRRTYTVRGDRLRIATRVENRSDVPAAHVSVEHPILAERFAVAPARLRFSAPTALPLADTGAPTDETVDTAVWEDAPTPPAYRFAAMPAGSGSAGAEVDGVDVALRWDPVRQPWLWFWLEAETTLGPPWDGRVRCVALEPAVAPTGDGLERAIARGTARTVPPGGNDSWWIEMRVSARDT